jgi:hypothetical protein
MATFYDDLGKNADDLIAKGYPADGSIKVSTETKTANGVSLITTGRRFVKSGQDGVEVLLEPKFNWAERNVEITGKLSTESAYEAGVSVKDLGAKGSKLSVTANQGKEGASYKGGADFKNETVAVKVSATYPDEPSSKPISADVSAVAAYENVNVGAKINATTAYTRGERETASSLFWSAKVGYLQPLWQLVGYWTNAAGNKNVVGGSFWQEVTPAVKLGTSFSVDRAAEKGSPSAAVSSEYKYAPDTIIRSKLGVSQPKDVKELRLGVALQQNWTTSSTVTIGADLNSLQLLGTNQGAPHSFGLEVKLK